MNSCQRLAMLLQNERDTLMSYWRTEVRRLPSARHLDSTALNDHIPHLLDELGQALSSEIDPDSADSFVKDSPPAHGLQRLQHKFEIEEVVLEYSQLRRCIHDLAQQHGIELEGKPFQILNTVLDNAIATAVRTFAVQQALEIRSRREDYLAFVAHDMRTPLNAVGLVANLLQETLSGEANLPRIQGLLTTLRRNVGYMNNLVEKVLAENANVETETGLKLERRKLDLWPLVESLIHDLRPIAGTGSALLINAIPEDMTVYADAALLKRVFQNLIANALSYAPDGEIFITGKELDGGTVECSVADNGPGIAPQRLASIFEKYETERPNAGGLGLGLAICKTFVEAHGGTIRAASEPGKGTMFCFTLPQRQ